MYNNHVTLGNHQSELQGRVAQWVSEETINVVHHKCVS